MPRGAPCHGRRGLHRRPGHRGRRPAGRRRDRDAPRRHRGRPRHLGGGRPARHGRPRGAARRPGGRRPAGPVHQPLPDPRGHRRRGRRGRRAGRRHGRDRRPVPRLRLAGRGRRGAGRLPGDGGSGGFGVNHDKSFRPRRQDRPQDLLETGAAYAMDAAGFREHQHRFFGRTELVRTDPARVLEIDDPHDLARARALAPLFDANRPGALAADPPPASPKPTTSTRSSSTSTAPRPTTGC